MGIKVYTITEEKRRIPVFGKKRPFVKVVDVDVDGKEYYRVMMHGNQPIYLRGRDEESGKLFAEVNVGDELFQLAATANNRNWKGVVSGRGKGGCIDTPQGYGFLMQGKHSSLLWWSCNTLVASLPVFSVLREGGESAHFVLAEGQAMCVKREKFFLGQTRKWMEANGLWTDYSDEIKINNQVVRQRLQKSTKAALSVANIKSR